MTLEERNQLIIKLYEEGKNTVTIAKTLGINSSTVQRYLKKQGYTLKRRSTELTPDEWNDIVMRFNNGERLNSIHQSYKDKMKSDRTIANALEREGIKTGKLVGGHDRLPVDDNFFEVIDTEEKAYYLGLMISDGFITASKNTVGIELDAEDKYILEAFKKALQSEHKIVSSRNCYRFTFVSHKMIGDLSKYGVVPQKTAITYLPKLEKHLMPHLIRGIFDGDGTVYRRQDGDGKRRCSFGFYGSQQLLEEIKAFLCQELGLNQTKIHEKKGCSMIYFGKQKDIVNFYNWIYEEATIYMTRKRAKFDSYFNEYVNTERAIIK